MTIDSPRPAMPSFRHYRDSDLPSDYIAPWFRHLRDEAIRAPYWEPPKALPETPTMAMAVAMIELAVRDLREPKTKVGNFRSAWDWMFVPDVEDDYTLEEICAGLGIDAGGIRRAALRLLQVQNPDELIRRRLQLVRPPKKGKENPDVRYMRGRLAA